MKTQVIAVKKVTKADGVQVVVDGQEKWIPINTIKAAAHQGDNELAATYQQIWDEVKRLAKLEKHLTIKIVNDTNVNFRYEPRLYDIAGEFVSGRIVGAGWGESGWHTQAVDQANEAKAKLEKQGYTVSIQD